VCCARDARDLSLRFQLSDAVLQSANNKTIIEADLAPPPPLPLKHKQTFINFLMSASPIQFGWMAGRALLYVEKARRGFYNPPWAGLAPLFYCPQTSQAATLGGDAMRISFDLMLMGVVLQRPKTAVCAPQSAKN
jgi:hypothetical protein